MPRGSPSDQEAAIAATPLIGFGEALAQSSIAHSGCEIPNFLISWKNWQALDASITRSIPPVQSDSERMSLRQPLPSYHRSKDNTKPFLRMSYDNSRSSAALRRQVVSTVRALTAFRSEPWELRSTRNRRLLQQYYKRRLLGKGS